MPVAAYSQDWERAAQALRCTALACKLATCHAFAACGCWLPHRLLTGPPAAVLSQAPPQPDSGRHLCDCSCAEAPAGEGFSSPACWGRHLLYSLGFLLSLMRVCSGVVGELESRAQFFTLLKRCAPPAQVAGIGDALATYFEVGAALLPYLLPAGCRCGALAVMPRRSLAPCYLAAFWLACTSATPHKGAGHHWPNAAALGHCTSPLMPAPSPQGRATYESHSSNVLGGACTISGLVRELVGQGWAGPGELAGQLCTGPGELAGQGWAGLCA